MAEVLVPLEVALDGALPPVCAITGKSADGAVSVSLGRSARKWRARTVRVPLSDDVFRKWSRRQNMHIKARAVAGGLAALAIVIATRSGFIGIALLVASAVVHVVDLRAEKGAAQLRPGLERQADSVLFSGVHESFVAAAIKASGGATP